MESVRQWVRAARKSPYRIHGQRILLKAASIYVEAVTTLRDTLTGPPLLSAGLCGVRERLGRYLGSATFTQLRNDVVGVLSQLDAVQYRIRIFADAVQVSAVDDTEDDYTRDIAQAFERFRQGNVRSYLSNVSRQITSILSTLE